MQMKVIAMATLLASLVVLTHIKQFVFADNVHIGNSSVCTTTCHAYRLIVEVPIKTTAEIKMNIQCIHNTFKLN